MKKDKLKPLIKSKARVKALGEVFTPPELVNEMLDKLPSVLWDDPTKTFIDPACGNGNFLVEVLRRKLSNGASVTQALSTTYGIDIMKDNVVECRQRLLVIVASGDQIEQSWTDILKRNIAVGDALKFDMDEIFGAHASDFIKGKTYAIA